MTMIQNNICNSCIHKCVFKNVVLCNISTNPTIFNGEHKVITDCIDYTDIKYAYPKINIHGLWIWDKGFCNPTPIILACKHTIAEYEQPSIEELNSKAFEIVKQNDIKLNGYPWIINYAEVSLNNIRKIYSTNLLSEEEIIKIVNQVNKNSI